MTSYKTINDLPPVTAATVADVMEIAQSGTSRSVTLGQIATTLGSPGNVLAWGADPTGVADSAPALQAAINWAITNGGGTVSVPPGLYRLATPVTITGSVTLEGAGWSENIPGIQPQWGGTYFNVTQTASPAFTVSGGAARGTAFKNFGIVQPQPAGSTPGWTPTVYAPAFYVSSTLGEVFFEDLFFAGIYQGINSYSSGRTTVRRIRGQTFSYFMKIDNSGGSDANHIDDVHLWNYWASDAPVVAWQQANGVGFLLGRVDSIQADHIFTLGYKAAVQLAGNATSGPATGIYIGSLNADAGLYAIWDTYTAFTFGYGSSLHVGHLHAGGITGSNAVQVDGKGARIQIDEIECVGIDRSIVNLTDASASLGSTVQIGSIIAQGAAAQFNLAGAYQAFNAVSKTGTPHQIALANPLIPGGAGNNAGGTCSGITNPNAAIGAAIVTDAGNTLYYNIAVASSTTYQIPNWCTLFMPGGSGLSNVTYKMPDVPIDGRRVTVVAGDDQTAVTFTSSYTIFNAPPWLSKGIGVTFEFLQVASAWVRIGGGDTKVLQTVSFRTGGMTTGATIIPFDDTPPQQTEGVQFLTLAVTPKSAASSLIVDVLWHGSANAISNIVLALFQDSTASALATGWAQQDVANTLVAIKLRHVLGSGTTSATTFKVRAGMHTAGTLTFNGVGSSSFMNGTLSSSIVIQEVLP